jgi:hypothetical protein
MLSLSVAAFATTNFPGGLTTANSAQRAAASRTPGPNDLYVPAAGAAIFDGPTYNYYGQNQELVLVDLSAASNTAFKNTDISTTTLAAAATTFTLAKGDYTDIVFPRNVVILSSCTTDGDAYTGIALVTGIDAKGNAATETIVVGTYTAVGVGIGNVAWSSISSVRLTTLSAVTTTATLKVQFGSGVKIGLPADIQAAADVYKVIEAGALTTTYTLNTTYDTITFVNAPDGSRDYHVFYKFIKR